MDVIEVTSLDDERLDAFARLTEAQLRNRLEPEKGIFIAESPKVIKRALDAGMQATSFLMEHSHLEEAAPLVEQAQQTADGNLPVFTGTLEALGRLTGFKLTRGVLCAMRRPALPSPDELLADARVVAVLDGIVDHTNVGSIFRNAAGLGIDAVLVSPSCCDPLYRRAVRVSMGTVFQVPWTRLGDTVSDWPDAGVAKLHAHGFACAALALRDDAIALDQLELGPQDKVALFFGTEGDGLSERTISLCDYSLVVPMHNGVDSLNVATASGIAFWQVTRKAAK